VTFPLNGPQDFETTDELENRAEAVRKACDQMVDEVGEERRMYTRLRSVFLTSLKGHGNEADFLGFLHKSVRHRSLALRFGPFRFLLRIRGDIRNRKTTPRLTESGSRQDCL
jgi:hypothetical protein